METKHHLLTLPAEIRNRIYYFVFGDEDWVLDDDDPMDAPFKATKTFKDPLALLRRCKQVYSEASDLPFTLCALHSSITMFPRDEDDLPKAVSRFRSLVLYHQLELDPGHAEGYEFLLWDPIYLLHQLSLLEDIHHVIEGSGSETRLWNSKEIADNLAFLDEDVCKNGWKIKWSLTMIHDGKKMTVFKDITSETLRKTLTYDSIKAVVDIITAKDPPQPPSDNGNDGDNSNNGNDSNNGVDGDNSDDSID